MEDKLKRFPSDEAMQLFILSDDCIKTTGGAGDIDTSKATAILFLSDCNITIGTGTVPAMIKAGWCFAISALKVTVDTDTTYALM